MTSRKLAATSCAIAIGGAATAAFVAIPSADAATHTHRTNSSLSIRAAKSKIAPGAQDIISGDLRSKGNPVKHRTVELFDNSGTTGWTLEKAKSTNRYGHAAFDVKPAADTKYRLVFRGDDSVKTAHSGVVTVKIVPTNKESIALSGKVVTSGATDTVTGVLTDPSGAPISGDTVTLRSRGENAKSGQVVSTMTSDATGSVSFSVTVTKTTAYRLVAAAIDGNAAVSSGWTVAHVPAPSSLSIRLRTASTGDDVVTGTLDGGGNGLKGRTVTLESSPDGTTWTDVSSVKADKNGHVVFDETAPLTATNYRLAFAGGPNYSASVSGTVTTTVASTS